MNSPRCSAAQNGCTTSGTWPVTNRAIHPSSQEAEEHSARARRGPGDPARADRRYGSPSGLASATTDAHPIKRPGRLLQPLPDDPVLRSPREPKGDARDGARRGYRMPAAQELAHEVDAALARLSAGGDAHEADGGPHEASSPCMARKISRAGSSGNNDGRTAERSGRSGAWLASGRFTEAITRS